jgi:uncharacterized repeat protein (TIGR03803 family)
VGCGTVYRVTAGGTFKTLYNFDGPHGCQSLAPLVLGTDGNFYGTTLVLTGVNNPNLGAIYKITPTGALTLVHIFDGTHGAEAYAPLMQASNGNFYGATVNGGMYGNGVVFEMTPAGAFTDLHDFDPNTEGGEPFSALVEGTNGFLYGTTAYGGTYNFGTIYSIPLGGGKPDTLYSFNGTTGTSPRARWRSIRTELSMVTPRGAAAMISGPSTHSAPASRRSSGLVPPPQKSERRLKSWARDSLALLPFLSMAQRRLSTLPQRLTSQRLCRPERPVDS